MSTEPVKVNPINQILMVVLAVCSALISVIFYSAKEDLHEMRKDINVIKLDVQQLKDHDGNKGDAINNLNRQYDYLLKTKADKKKPSLD